MTYNSLSDMLLDNRRCLEKRMIELHASKEVTEEALSAFDWLASECLRGQASYNALLKTIDELYGEGESKQADAESVKYFGEILTANAPYCYDITHGRKVGYSAEEDKDNG